MTHARGLLIALAFVASAWPARAQTPAPHDHGDHQAPPPQVPTDPQAGHDHRAPASATPPASTAAAALLAFIRPLTDADRAAAFPDVGRHAMLDTSINTFVLFDQFEWQSGDGSEAFAWDAKGWVGQDRDRFWFRAEGDRAGGRTEQAQVNLLYGRAIARWWDLTAGVRVDPVPGAQRAALAIGVQGLAPYWFDIEASAYLEPSGRTHIRVETDYDLLITNRLVFQPLLEFEVYGRADEARFIAAGLATGELGLRLRYEFRREFAPYVGIVWSRRFFGSADLARAADRDVAGTRWAVGVRTWF